MRAFRVPSAARATAQRLSTCATLLLLFVVICQHSSAQTSPPDKKQLEATSRQLIAEGKALEDHGELAEAKNKYIDAEGVFSTGTALDGIHRINDEIKQKVESLLADVHRLYDSGKTAQSIEQVRQGLDLDRTNPALHYDLALCYLRQGDRENAALQLDLAIGDVSNRRQREELLELRSTVLTGIAAPAVTPEFKERLEAFNDSYLQENRDPGDKNAAGGSLCDQTKDLRAAFNTSAAIAFNSAKCASEDSRPEDAAHELADYLKSAPDTLDRESTEFFEQNFDSLASLKDDPGQVVRKHYATAERYLDYRRYGRAIAEYDRAAEALPNYAETQWRLALLYEAYGDVQQSRAYFQRYQQLEQDASRKSRADVHLTTLDERRAIYDANVGDAEDIISNLLLRSMGIATEGEKHKGKLTHRQRQRASSHYKEAARATEKLSAPYVERELRHAREDLDSATEVFPLGAEANELLALIYLQQNNWPEAYGSYDAVASQNFPVSFYAQVNSAHDTKIVRATKVEIGQETIRLVDLSSYDPKRQVSTAPDQSAGDDDLGNLVVSSTTPPDADAEAVTIHAADVRGIATDKNFVVIKLDGDQIYLAPLNMLSDVPFEGGASRAYGNEYTRLFVRYLGYENAKLDTEGMTAGEKFRLGMEIAQIGVAVGMMGVGAPAAYGSAVHVARIMHAIQVHRSMAMGMRTAGLAAKSIRLADNLQVSIATLERTAADQQRVIEGMQFKILPAQQIQLKYREKL